MTASDTSLEDVLSDREGEDGEAAAGSRFDRYRTYYRNWVYAPTRIVLSDPRGVLGLSILLLYGLMGTVGVYLVEPTVGTEPGPIRLGAFENWAYPLGTDHLGNGLFALTVHSTPPMFIMIGTGAIFSTSMATVFGTVAGYKGGSFDQVIMGITDVVLTIPGLPLIIVLSAIIEPTNPAMIGLLLTITSWAGLARMIRSETLSLRRESYVEASRVIGAPSRSIILRDILPNLMPYVLVNFTRSARKVIFSSVALYFLGVLPFSTLNWGIMLNSAFQEGALFQVKTLYWLVVPMVTIVLLTTGLIVLSQSFDRVFNARARVRHRDSTRD